MTSDGHRERESNCKKDKVRARCLSALKYVCPLVVLSRDVSQRTKLARLCQQHEVNPVQELNRHLTGRLQEVGTLGRSRVRQKGHQTK